MVVWSAPSVQDLRNIHDYISRDSEFYADKVIDEFLDNADKLVDFPKMGRVVPELEDSAVREIMVYSYRLVYELGEDRIEILAIIHGKQNFFGNNIES